MDQEKRAQTQVVTIDAARGLFAIAVMVYHLLYFNGIAQVERVAYYAVYGFFVISGFALYITYCDRLATIHDLRAYFIKRFFRIAPLYFVVLIARLCVPPLPGDLFYRLLLNFTLMFGFANPGSTALNGGGWSIGIEMVFYLVLPFIIILCRNSLARLTGLTVFASLVAVLFINMTLRGNQGVMTSELWERYTQPVAFFGYFTLGVTLGATHLSFPGLKGSRFSFAIIVAGLVPLLLLQSNTDLQLLTGGTGLVLASATCLLVVGAALLPEPRGRLRSLAIWLGAMSYPVYLIHLLVTTFLRNFLAPGLGSAAVAALVTVALSMIVNWSVEKPFREIGKQIAERN